MRFADLRFWTHRMAGESARHLNMPHIAESLINLVTARQAIVLIPNGYSVSIITMVAETAFARMLHGSPTVPDYEVMVNGPEQEDPIYDCSPDTVMRLIHAASIHPVVPKNDPYGEREEGRPAYWMSAHLYDPAVHGSFFYEEAYNYDAALWANKIQIPVHRWRELRQHGSTDDPYRGNRAVNAWCAQNCQSDFAWTAASPSWVFRDSRDATLFKVAFT